MLRSAESATRTSPRALIVFENVGAVEGAIEAAKTTTVNVEEAAAAAATGAIEAAGEIGEEAAHRVRRSVVGTIQGVKVVVKTTVGKT